MKNTRGGYRSNKGKYLNVNQHHQDEGKLKTQNRTSGASDPNSQKLENIDEDSGTSLLESAEIAVSKGKRNSVKNPLRTAVPNQKQEINNTNSVSGGPDQSKRKKEDTNEPVNNPAELMTAANSDGQRKTKTRGPFYLGLASAVLLASIGLGLSTLPIFFSLPLAAVLFGIGIWLLSYAGFRPSQKPGRNDVNIDRRTKTIIVSVILVVLQSFIIDVFIFTRLGTVDKHQDSIIIIWIIASLVETLASLTFVYKHNPLQTSFKNRGADVQRSMES